MRKILCIILCIGITMTGCTHKGEASSTSGIATSVPTPYYTEPGHITETLNTNDELLAKYVKASGNNLISLFGLGDLMTEVKAEAQTAEDNTAECLEIVGQLADNPVLSKYDEEFSEVQLSLSTLNDKMKEAKRSKNIDQIEITLKNILSELQDYNKILEQLIKEEG